MNKGVVLKRLCIVGVVFLFVASAAIPSTSRMNEISPLINENDGTLSGYVTDTSMNPIEGALVRVYFHETYEEDYTDEIGYYHVTNIPICWCYKNCTASKEGYETEWVWLGIYENTTYGFVLTPLTPYDGSLLGYVNDTSMNPIEGALVRVCFHGTYEEDYTDSSGYYHVTNIPICYCLKNATASKEGYETEWILLSITENTTHDFVLTSLDPVPDLECEGDLDWIDVVPGATVTGTITVENIGEPDSLLNWEIVSWPDWGTWCFDPEYGTDLLAGDMMTVNVEVVFPDPPEEEQWSEIIIVNSDNPDDFCVIDVYYSGEAVPVVKNINQQFTTSLIKQNIMSTVSSHRNRIEMTSFEPIPDLDCSGNLGFNDVIPGSTVYGFFTVENIGEPLSLLDWEIESHPDWGTWTFTPGNGEDLTPEFSPITIGVTIVAPEDPNTEFTGEVRVVNCDDPSDYDIINIYLFISFSQQFTTSSTSQILHQSINTLYL